MVSLLTAGGLVDLEGIAVTERTALAQSPMYRAVKLVADSLAQLPTPTYREAGAGQRERVPSVFDNPDTDDGQTPFEWWETGVIHAMLHGRAGALIGRSPLGTINRLQWRHPRTWAARPPTVDDYQRRDLPAGGLWFDVAMDDGTRQTFDARDFWYVPAVSLDGREGVGLLQLGRESLRTTIAGETASGRLFAEGALIRAIATPKDPDEDLSDDLPQLRRELDAYLHGPENAGKIALLNARLDVSQVAMTAVDAQLLQSRQFQVEEVSRWTGVPPHLLMQTEKQTSWGTGVEEQNRALGRTELSPWAVRFEQRGSRLLQRPRWIEKDFTALERPAPDKEREMIRSDWNDDLITLNEARERMKLKPIPGGDRRKSEMTAAAAPDPVLPGGEGGDE
jgi:HK97 family phage portal protein